MAPTRRSSLRTSHTSPTSEQDSTHTTPNSNSRADTPSTAPTSVIMAKRQSRLATDDSNDESEDEEAVVKAGSRPTPQRRSSTKKAFKKGESMDVDPASDSEDDEGNRVVITKSKSRSSKSGTTTTTTITSTSISSSGGSRKLAARSAKGKGKAVAVSSSEEEEEEVKAEDEEDEEMDWTADEDEDEESQQVKKLAKSLSNGNAKSKGKGKAKGKGLNATDLGRKLISSLKGKGKATSPHFSLEIPTPTSNTTSGSSSPSINPTSKFIPKRKSSSLSKQRRLSTSSSSSSSDSSDEGSAFAPSSLSNSPSLSALSSVDSDIELLDDFSLPEDSSDEEEKESLKEKKKRLEKMKKRAKKGEEDDEEEAVEVNEEGEKVRKPKEPPRKGAHISQKETKGLTRAEKTTLTLTRNHPELKDCWTNLYAMPPRVPTPAEQPSGLTQKLLPFQLEGLDWMMKQEKGIWGGGMLADEMGMGKTIQTIALILSDHTPGGDKKCTLVLAPTVALMQWKNEIEKFTKGFKVLVFHGSARVDNVKEVEKFDVVLTSYAVLESGFRRENKGFQRKGKLMKEDSILHKVKWHRVILDEAHNIKDRACNTAKAAFALKSKYRWCLSGTPLQNRVGELYSLIRFLGADPFAYYMCKKCDCKSLHWLCNKGPCSECRHSGMQHVCYWNNDILKPIQYGGASSGEGKVAFKKLTTLLGQMMLRRTKIERADDMGLPPRVIGVRRDYFTEEEEEIYQSLFKDVKRKFSTYAHEGTVLNNYSNIFTLITRMRQMADHPSLVTRSRTAQPIEHADGDKPEEILTCRICLDEAEDAVQSSCRHIFCRECVRQYLETAIEQKPECPVCHLHMTIDLDQEAIEQDTSGRQGFLSRIDPSKDRTSTKIEALLEELSKSRTEDHTLKTLVFSQFTSMLDMVERRLQLGGFRVARLQGNMTPTARDNTIKYFMNNPDVTVFLISLKAGGVALNLIEASRCIILDPWVELQAMDRIHRIGQHRPVEITRLIIENSIESRILELQKKKENLASSALGDDDKALGRLTPEDLRFLFSL